MVIDKCSFKLKFNKMEENKKLAETPKDDNEKLHLSGVIKSVCTYIQTDLPCGFPCYPQCPLYEELDKQTVL